MRVELSSEMHNAVPTSNDETPCGRTDGLSLGLTYGRLDWRHQLQKLS